MICFVLGQVVEGASSGGASRGACAARRCGAGRSDDGIESGKEEGAWGWDSLDLLRPNVVHSPVIPELFQFARLSVAPKSIPREEYKKQ